MNHRRSVYGGGFLEMIDSKINHVIKVHAFAMTVKHHGFLIFLNVFNKCIRIN